MSVTFKVVPPSKNELRKVILRGIAKAVNAKLPRIAARIQSEIKTTIPAALKVSSEYSALVNGPLDAHFGFEAGTAKIRADRIIDEFSRHASVDVIPLSVLGSGLRGGIEIVVPTTAIQAILSLPESHVEDMPWLEWLLFRGDSVVVSGYKILFKSTSFSRSGYAIMAKSASGVWRVPSQYSGTENDNWITRTMEELERQLAITIRQTIASEL